MGVDEDEDVGYRGGEREGVFQESPSMRICVEDDGQQGGGGILILSQSFSKVDLLISCGAASTILPLALVS
jgi:hypothetical protein